MQTHPPPPGTRRSFVCLLAVASVVALLGCVRARARQEAAARWPAPTLADDNYRQWLAFLRPTGEELSWRQVRWHHSLSGAAAEARQLQRPVLLWTMNGHPCGET